MFLQKSYLTWSKSGIMLFKTRFSNLSYKEGWAKTTLHNWSDIYSDGSHDQTQQYILNTLNLFSNGKRQSEKFHPTLKIRHRHMMTQVSSWCGQTSWFSLSLRHLTHNSIIGPTHDLSYLQFLPKNIIAYRPNQNLEEKTKQFAKMTFVIMHGGT